MVSLKTKVQSAPISGFTLYKLPTRQALFFGGGGRSGGGRSGGFWVASVTADKKAKRLVDFQ